MEQKQYEESKSYISCYDLNNKLIQLKSEKPELGQIHSQALQQVAMRVHLSYQLFFKHAIQHPPNFRSCRNFFNITYPQNGYSIRGNKFITKIYGSISIKLHRPIKGTIKQVSLGYNEGWYLNITTDHTPIKPGATTRVAIDLGITNLATTSTGETITGPTHQKHFDTKIDQLKTRRDSTCKKGSIRFKHISKVVKHLYSVKTRKTNDSLHKISKDLSSKYDTVILEQLNVKGLGESKITGRNRMIHNACVARFVDLLKYKMNRVIEVNPMYTSQTCSLCHHKLDKKLQLKDRTFKCPSCALSLDRDHNAAVNISQLGLAVCSKLVHKLVSIVDIPPLVWLDDDVRICLEQAIQQR
jgi:putative transposase